MKKRILSAVLVLALYLSLLPAALAAEPGLDNFGKVNEYTAQTFTDVAAGSWYAENVQTAYELDLMKGVSADAFSPDGPITVGSAIALACRLHSIYHTGEGDFVQGSPWYQVYVDYAVTNGIITAGQFTDYNASATRRQFAAILAKALPAETLKAFNTVDDGMIPDVAAGAANADDIYMLYRAGILTGSDAKGTFAPETSIGRSSVAAIVSRMAVPALRQSITLKAPVAVTAVTLSQASLSLKEGASAQLTATVTPADADDAAVTWTSSNPAVASVNNGAVQGLQAGSAVITASAGGKKATCSVTVKAGINLSASNLSSLKTYLSNADSDLQKGISTLDLNKLESSAAISGDRMAVIFVKSGINYGGMAVLDLDNALKILNAQGEIPISWGGYTSLRALVQSARDELWSVELKAQLVSDSSWRSYAREARTTENNASEKIQAALSILANAE